MVANPKPEAAISCAQDLAADYSQLRSQARQAADTLHDEVGSSLVAAGLQLQILRMDFPAIAAQLDEMTGLLEQTMAAVRTVSRDLAPSTVRAVGLKSALADLIAQQTARISVPITLDYQVRLPLPATLADFIFHTVELFLSALTRTDKGALVSVSGVGPFTLRIRIDKQTDKRIDDRVGRGVAAADSQRNQFASNQVTSNPFMANQGMLKAILFAKTCCKRFTIDHRQATIMTMQYAHQRSVS